MLIIKIEIATVASFIAIVFICVVYTTPIKYKSSNRVCSPKIKAAIYKMGPGKDYRLFSDGRLEVKVEGEWLRLRYEGR